MIERQTIIQGATVRVVEENGARAIVVEDDSGESFILPLSAEGARSLSAQLAGVKVHSTVPPLAEAG